MASYLGMLNLGFNSAYMRYYSKYKVKEEELRRLNGMFLCIFSFLGALSLLCGCILINQMDVIFKNSLTSQEIEKARTLMVIMVLNISFTFPFNVFMENINVNEHHFFVNILKIIKSVITPFLVIPVLLQGYGSIWLVIVAALLTKINEILKMFYALKKLDMKFNFKKFDFVLFQSILVYCSFIILNIVAERINWDVDKFLLGVFQDTREVAVYSVAAQLKGYYFLFSVSLSTVFIPKTFQLASGGGSNLDLTHLVTKIGRLQFLVLSLILGGLLLLGKPFILFWAGPEYGDVYGILLFLAIPAIIPNIQSLGGAVQNAKNMHRFRCVLYFGIAICNLLLTIPLCKAYGGIGCAFSTALSTLIGHGLIMNIYYHKKIGLDMIFFWKEILLLARGLMIPYMIVFLIYHSSINLYELQSFLISGVFYVFVFAVSIWFIGMNDYEKNMIKSAFVILKNKKKWKKFK